MNHTLKTTLLLVFLFSVTTYLGLVLTQTNLSDLLSGREGLTSAIIAENCEGDDCPPPVIGCGGGEGGYACLVACYDDEDCDDTIAQTEDICRNPGTENSLCVNRIRKN